LNAHIDPLKAHDPYKIILGAHHLKDPGFDFHFFMGNHFLDDNPSNQEDFAFIQFLGQHWRLNQNNWQIAGIDFELLS
jgi:hypothetical protein